MTERLKVWKVLNEDGRPYHGGNGKWSLPDADQLGEWMPEIDGRLVPCERGYHLCRKDDLIQWLGPAIYEAEYRGTVVTADDKIVVSEARLLRKLETWNGHRARLFAADVAEHVLSTYEDRYPEDDRPRKAIEAARKYARGEITLNELSAASSAAYRAASSAASRAASSAASRAASSAAYRAASRAASSAASSAADRAERQWQTQKLFEYLYPDNK